jgi:hypothetical protein
MPARTSEPGIVRKGNLTMDQAPHDQEFSQWARSIDTFETTVKRISELPDLVYSKLKSDTSEINVRTS